MFFILRKDYNVRERREILSILCSIFDVEGIDKAKLVSGLQNEDLRLFIPRQRHQKERASVLRVSDSQSTLVSGDNLFGYREP